MSAAYMRRCAGKTRHEAQSEANEQRVKLAKAYGLPTGNFDVYRCDQCLGWHVGGASRKFASRRRSGKRPNKRLRGR